MVFRGGLQSLLMRLFGNPHVAIWIAAIVFSAIHMQFFGFVPRVLLGAFSDIFTGGAVRCGFRLWHMHSTILL